MERLTHKRVSGIKEGYWSPNKKQELVDRLAAYENTGLTPEQVQELAERNAPNKPIKMNDETVIRYTDAYRCPNCGKSFSGTGIADYCYHCGQRLDWSEEDGI